MTTYGACQEHQRNVLPIGPTSGHLNDSRKSSRISTSALHTAASLDQAARAHTRRMAQAEKAFGAIEKAGSRESPVMYQLSQTLEKISDASDSLRALSDYLNRHPEALLRGRN